MKFLCLSGIGFNPETFRRELLPIVQNLEQHGEHSFHYMAGSLELAGVTGLMKSLSAGPYLRFLESTWPGATNEQVEYEAFFGTPGGLTPEDRLRYLERRLPPKNSPLLRETLLEIRRRFEEDGPFDCILGHSEGAVIAATFVIESLKNSATGSKVVLPKCAVFMNGGAPHTGDGKGWLVADECGQLITIPTCHIMAHNDAVADDAVALYHICEEDLASIVDHGRGHAIPKDTKSCKLIVQAIRDLINRARDGARNAEVAYA